MEEKLKDKLTSEDLLEVWEFLSAEERLEGLRELQFAEAQDFFFSLSSSAQAKFLESLPKEERRLWLRSLAPDDAADLLQQFEGTEQAALLSLLDANTCAEVTALLAYAEDRAGGLMSPRFARVRPSMTVDQAITYLKKQSREYLESIYYIYVLNEMQHLMGVVSFRELIKASPDKKVEDVMIKEVISVHEQKDQELVGQLFSQTGLIAIPVIDDAGCMKGIVTVDDIVEVVQEEATEDIQKLGGMEALDAPYLEVSLWEMIRKRAGWLVLLFIGEMFTATAMGYFEADIAKAVVLALFIPLIISSGGNSGSQATTLLIRAMAVGHVSLKDIGKVFKRELVTGFCLGAVLGMIGFLRIIIWQQLNPLYGEHYLLVGMAVSFSLLGVVMFGTLVGSLLPFLLKRVGFDPASASAPFVATLVDVTGLVIYFSIASLILRGALI